MSQLFVSQTHERATAALFEQLKTVDPKALSEQHVVIVPDRYTLSAERALARALGGVFFNVTVTTLRRFASRFLRLPFISGSGAVMLMRTAVLETQSALTCFKHAARFPGFAAAMCGERRRLAEEGKAPCDLTAAAEGLSGEEGARLRDAALIFTRYDALIEGKYTGAGGFYRLICDAAPHSPLVREAHFYAAGFDTPANAEGGCFDALLKSGASFTAACTHAELPAFAGLFDGAGKTVQTVHVPAAMPPLFAHMAAHLGSVRPPAFPGGAEGSLRLYRLPDADAEVEHTARLIVRDITQRGLRFKDIAVVSGCLKEYLLPLHKHFTRYGIPYYVSEGTFLTESPLFAAVMSRVTCAASGFAPDAALSAARRGGLLTEDGSPVLQEDVDRFENYCLKFGIAYSRFAAPFTLGGEEDCLTSAETVRQALIRAVSGFAAGRQNAAQFAASVRTAAQSVAEGAAFAGLLSALRREGCLAEAAAAEESGKRFAKLLDELCLLSGDGVRALEDWAAVLKSGAESVKLSVVPVAVDTVSCGGTELLRFSGAKSVYVLGAREGALPAPPAADALLSWDGKAPGAQLAERLAEQQQRVRAALCVPRGCLTLSCPERGVKGGAVLPAELFFRIKAVAGGTDAPLPRPFRQPSRPYPMLEYALRDAEQLFFRGGAVSASVAECYYTCPRKHFYAYGLRAREREDAALNHLDRGIFIHGALERFVKAYTDGADVGALLQDCCRAEAALAVYDRFFRRKGGDVLLRRLCADLKLPAMSAAAHLRASRFTPALFEAVIGEGGDFPPVVLEAAGGAVSVRGKIDRVDTLELGGVRYARVIDYKSGSVSGNRFDVKSLYTGERIQLFVYMKALNTAGCRAAGLYYFPLRGAFEETPQTLKLSGITLSDEAVLAASDAGLAEGNPQVLETDKGSKLLSAEEMARYIDYAAAMVRGAVEEARQGFIAPSPAKGACEYCAYAGLCGGTPAERALPARFGAEACIAEAEPDSGGEDKNVG